MIIYKRLGGTRKAAPYCLPFVLFTVKPYGGFMHYIYSLTNKESGHVYIGQSKNPTSRLRSHKSSVLHGSKTKIHNAMRSYGFDCFSLSVLASAPTRDLINILERQYILIYDTIKNGYNICPGGEGISSEMASAIFSRKDVRDKASERSKAMWKDENFRKKRIEEMKKNWTPEKRRIAAKRISESWTEERINKQKKRVNDLWMDKEYIKKQSDAKKRHWADPEYRQKMCASSKRTSDPIFLKNLAINNWKDPERAKRMSQGRKTGHKQVICLETLKIYKDLAGAERDTGIKRRCISMQVNGKMFRAGKLHWSLDCQNMTREKADAEIKRLEQKRKEKLIEIWAKRKQNARN